MKTLMLCFIYLYGVHCLNINSSSSKLHLCVVVCPNWNKRNFLQKPATFPKAIQQCGSVLLHKCFNSRSRYVSVTWLSSHQKLHNFLWEDTKRQCKKVSKWIGVSDHRYLCECNEIFKANLWGSLSMELVPPSSESFPASPWKHNGLWLKLKLKQEKRCILTSPTHLVNLVKNGSLIRYNAHSSFRLLSWTSKQGI